MVALSGLICSSDGVIAQRPKTTRDSEAVETPSLRDTSEWLRNTFPPRSGYKGCREFDSAKPDAEYGEDFHCFVIRYAIDITGCEVKLYAFHSETGSSCPATGCVGFYSKRDDSIASFSLSDIDRSSIFLGEPYGSFGLLKDKTYHINVPEVDVHLSTTNAAKRIKLTFSKTGDVFQEDQLGDVGTHIAVEPEYAPRFVKALQHGAMLCGAKPSAF